jgi:hypothetical protein
MFTLAYCVYTTENQEYYKHMCKTVLFHLSENILRGLRVSFRGQWFL